MQEEELRGKENDFSGLGEGEPLRWWEKARGSMFEASVGSGMVDDSFGLDGDGAIRGGSRRREREEVEIHLGREALWHVGRSDPARKRNEGI